eukprot:gene6926-9557_t
MAVAKKVHPRLLQDQSLALVLVTPLILNLVLILVQGGHSLKSNATSELENPLLPKNETSNPVLTVKNGQLVIVATDVVVKTPSDSISINILAEVVVRLQDELTEVKAALRSQAQKSSLLVEALQENITSLETTLASVISCNEDNKK